MVSCAIAFAACGHDQKTQCVDRVQCAQGAHWDETSCMCVLDGDMGESCSTSCAGGTKGCSGMCPGGCSGGQLCCPWAGGACQPTDAGTCQAPSGFSCAMPTTEGLCPSRCYP